jgi:hypothetical protein
VGENWKAVRWFDFVFLDKGRTWTERTSWTLSIVFLFEATSREIGGFSGGIFVVRCARKTDLKQR